MKNENFTCVECDITQEGSAFHHTSDDSDLCGICADVVYVECVDCATLIKRDDVEQEYNGDALCNTCRADDYSECADCDELLHNDNDCCHTDNNDSPVCEGCSEDYIYDELNDQTICMNDAVTATHYDYGRGRGQTEVITSSDTTTCINGDYYTDAAVDELFTCCEGCNEHIDREEALYTDDYGYCEGCYPGDGCDEDVNHTDMGDDIDGETFDDCTSHRKYGVEIECTCAADASHSNDTAFECKGDGSVDSGGAEFVSPILQGDDGFEELEKLCKILKSNYADSNSSCGLHIHIDLNDFNELELARLFYFVQKLEPIARKFVPVGRNNNQYCTHRIDGMDFTDVFRNGTFYNLQRYSAYNFQAYNHHKTLSKLHKSN